MQKKKKKKKKKLYFKRILTISQNFFEQFQVHLKTILEDVSGSFREISTTVAHKTFQPPKNSTINETYKHLSHPKTQPPTTLKYPATHHNP